MGWIYTYTSTRLNRRWNQGDTMIIQGPAYTSADKGSIGYDYTNDPTEKRFYGVWESDYSYAPICFMDGYGNPQYYIEDSAIAGGGTVLSHTVSYNANGGTGAPASQTKIYGSILTLSSTKPTRTGYTFQGWGTSANATTVSYVPGGQYGDDQDITLYAIWTVNTYTVSYNANGGGGAPSRQIKTYGATLTLTSAKPSTAKSYTITYNANNGTVTPASKAVVCTFSKWNTKSDGTGTSYDSGGTYAANSAVTLYAQWTNPTAGTLPTPSRTGYTFNGWYTSASGGNKVTSSTTISSSITIYAHWSIITYTVSYNANGGSGAPSSQTKTYNIDLTLSSTKPTRTGYIFKGWAMTSTGNVEYQPGSKYGRNSSAILYAIWEVITYTITYNLNGGTNPSGTVTNYTIESSTITLPCPTRIGYEFKGWYSSLDLSGNSVTIIPKGSTGNKSYYAKWESLNVIYYKINDTWKLCNTYIKVDGAWKAVVIYNKINDVWKRSIAN